jgi:hypothetical protein
MRTRGGGADARGAEVGCFEAAKAGLSGSPQLLPCSSALAAVPFITTSE